MSPELAKQFSCSSASGQAQAMTELDALAGALDRYHLYHATRADLPPELGAQTRPAPPTASPST
jgi:RNA polymerase sigma-70 factor (ECF subfamily)